MKYSKIGIFLTLFVSACVSSFGYSIPDEAQNQIIFNESCYDVSESATDSVVSFEDAYAFTLETKIEFLQDFGKPVALANCSNVDTFEVVASLSKYAEERIRSNSRTVYTKEPFNLPLKVGWLKLI